MFLSRSYPCLVRLPSHSRRVVVNVTSPQALHTEAKLEELGIKLPEVIAAKGNYMSFVRSGNQLFLAGQKGKKLLVVGTVIIEHLDREESNILSHNAFYMSMVCYNQATYLKMRMVVW